MRNLKYYTDDKFVNEVQQNQIFHGFFTRQGGISEGVYAGLNCGLGSGDNPDYVAQNRASVAKVAGVAAAHLLSVHQVHGNCCMVVDAPWDVNNRPKADALVTDKIGFALGILTADCAPVLFLGHKQNGAPVIGAAHAGWKGALGGVLGTTISQMENLGAQKETIKAYVGPCIAKASYEVGVDFIEPFLEEHDESGRFFQMAQQKGKAFFDLAGYCAWRMFRDGLRKIILQDHDTYHEAEEFYSYRRATHKQESDYGRQISVISLRGAA